MAHVDNSSTVSGILNLEWTVRLPGNKRDAILDEATARTAVRLFYQFLHDHEQILNFVSFEGQLQQLNHILFSAHC